MWTGHVEIMVKLTKKSLRGLQPKIEGYLLDDCLFQTLIKRAQGYINSRPLVWDPVKSQSISPADFLGTGSRYLVGPQIGGDPSGKLVNKLQLVEKVWMNVWNHFRQNYLDWLRKSFGTLTRHVPQEGDIVTVSPEEEFGGG